LEGTNLADFGLETAGNITFQINIAGISSKSSLQPGPVIYDSLSTRKEAWDKDEWMKTVEKRFKKTKEAKPLKR
jgi:hypothetical protein